MLHRSPAFSVHVRPTFRRAPSRYRSIHMASDVFPLSKFCPSSRLLRTPGGCSLLHCSHDGPRPDLMTKHTYHLTALVKVHHKVSSITEQHGEVCARNRCYSSRRSLPSVSEECGRQDIKERRVAFDWRGLSWNKGLSRPVSRCVSSATPCAACACLACRCLRRVAILSP